MNHKKMIYIYIIMKRQNILLCSILLLLVYYLFQIYNKNDNNNDINNNNKNDIVFNDQVLYIENFLSEKDYHKILELDTDKRGFKNENFRYIKPLNNRDVTNIFYNEKTLMFFGDAKDSIDSLTKSFKELN